MASATPRRGKFLSPSSSSPSSSAPETPSAHGKFHGKPVSSPPSALGSSRGKFLGKPMASPTPLQGVASGGPSAGDNATDSLENLRSLIHTSKITATSRRKAIARQRDRVFQDLDEAENIVLSLLECASDVAGALSEMTTAKSNKRHGLKGDDGEENAEDSFEDLTAKVRSNGVGYLTGVKKLHKLLAPHALLVKSYRNHDGEESAESDKQSHISVAAVLPGTARTTKRISSNMVEEATSNMYAARVKKRLAMERSKILTEMIGLEELVRGNND